MHPRLSTSIRCALGGLAVLLLSAGSCVDTDIGAPCQLQKDRFDESLPGCRGVSPDDIAQHPECFHPTAGELNQGKAKDYISFGAAECDNLTCVRSRGEPDLASETEPSGYCSGECINDQDCASENGKFSCRALVFDDEFLHYLADTLSPEEYNRYLGRLENSKFCTRAQ
ncbi:adventurous gliding motility lipoprotein CglC [Vulgatibacter incomptus]|nr:adventurous gliding motility lipoprotein CglC [Vulgatibacter incomptus]